MDSKKRANLKEAMSLFKGQGKSEEKKGSIIENGGGAKDEGELDFKAKLEKLRQNRKEEKDRPEQGKEKDTTRPTDEPYALCYYS